MNDVARRLYGIFPDADIVIAGGAARDWATGNPCKDYDVFILNGNVSCADIVANLELFGDCTEYEVFDHDNPDYSEVPTGHLEWVVKAKVGGQYFDFIKYVADITSAVQQVELFDCTINMVWFDKLGRVCYHPRATTGGTIHYMLEDNPIRMAYLQRKFPHSSFIPFKKEPTCAAV